MAYVPLKALMTIPSHTGRDTGHLVPRWIAHEMTDFDGDRLYRASKRMISLWEFGLVALAQDIYLGYDDLLKELDIQ